MNKKIIWSVIIILVIIVAVIAIASRSRTVSGTISIGAALGLSGYASEWGEGEQKAIQLAVDAVNNKGGISGKKIIITTEDTLSTGGGTVNAITKLVSIDNVVAIIGPTWGDSFQGGFPITEKNHIPVITPSGALEAVENKSQLPYLFSTWWPQELELHTLATYLNSHNLKKVALINDIDPFNRKAIGLFSSEAENLGLTIVEREEVPVGTSDFRTVISKIKARDPQAIFIELQDTASIGPFNKQLKELGTNAVVFGTTNIENPDNLKKFPGLFDGVIYSFPHMTDTPSYKSFATAFNTKYGIDPSGPSIVNAYNATLILIAALEKGATTGEEIKNQLETIHTNGVGVTDLSFDSNGQINGVQFDIKTVKDGKFVILEQ